MSLLSDGLLVATALAAGGVAVRAWLNRPTAGAAGLAGFAGSVAIWAVAHLGAHYTGGGAHLGFEMLRWTALVPAAFLWFVFVLDYTGRERFLRRRYLAVLLGPPALLAALLWLPEGSGLSLWPGFEAERGPVFRGYLGASYGLLAVGSAMLLARVGSLAVPFRRQGVAVLAALAVGWGGTVVGVFQPFGDAHLHAVPVGFAAMAGLLLAAVLRGGLSGIAPIARRAVVHTLAAGVIAVDDERRVTEINPAARRLLGIAPGATVVGRPLGDVVDAPELLEATDAVDTSDPSGAGAGDGGAAGSHSHSDSDSGSGSGPGDGSASALLRREDRVLDCEFSALSDDLDRHVGGVLIIHDVTEERRRRAQLERQNERLESFAGVVSHDLRNPLTVAVGRVDLAREACDCGRADEHLDAAATAHDRMEALIDDLLALARQDAAALSPEPVALPAVVEDCRETVVGDGKLDVSVANATIRADPARLRQLVENLLKNALEHGSTSSRSQAPGDAVEHGSTSPSNTRGDTGGPAVSVAVGTLDGTTDGADDGSATREGFFVEDDGPGIPPDERDRVLEAGYSTADDGTGFGLLIVREVAAAHDWDVTVTEGRDDGGRFEITGVEVVDPP